MEGGGSHLEMGPPFPIFDQGIPMENLIFKNKWAIVGHCHRQKARQKGRQGA